MKTVSSRFVQEARHSHTVLVSVLVRDPSTGATQELAGAAGVTLTGTVVLDRTRDIRSSFDLKLVDEDGTLTPAEAEDLLAPFGNELVITRGIRLSTGVEETVALGTFLITSLNVLEDKSGTVISLSGYDYGLAIKRNRWDEPYVIPAGTAVEDAVEGLLVDRRPGTTVGFGSTGLTTPLVVLEAGSSADPWRDARALASAAGLELYFDGAGVAQMTTPAAITDPPVLTYQSGEEAVLLQLSRQVSTASSVYNGVIAIGEGTGLDAPVRATAWDDDPLSATYYLGKFGKVPYFYSSPLLLTEAQAQLAADTRLAGILGAAEQVDWSQIVNPALEPNDVVQVSGAGLASANVLLDAVTIPLDTENAMTATGRRKFQ